MDKTIFSQQLEQVLKTNYRKSPEKASVYELHNAVSDVVMDYISKDWENSRRAHLENRRACYLSMEFLMGRAVHNNLLCLGLTETVDEALKEHGRSLAELEEIEDAALGNGGLGRLAACFLDSAAALELPLDGYGIRYKYGLFKQLIEDGYQVEVADNWQKFEDPWCIRKEDEAVTVSFKAKFDPDKTDDEIMAVFTVADALRHLREQNISTKIFDSGLGISVFRDNSTRTRFSFGSACNLLGLEVQDLDEKKSQIAHRKGPCLPENLHGRGDAGIQGRNSGAEAYARQPAV